MGGEINELNTFRKMWYKTAFVLHKVFGSKDEAILATNLLNRKVEDGLGLTGRYVFDADEQGEDVLETGDDIIFVMETGDKPIYLVQHILNVLGGKIEVTYSENVGFTEGDVDPIERFNGNREMVVHEDWEVDDGFENLGRLDGALDKENADELYSTKLKILQSTPFPGPIPIVREENGLIKLASNTAYGVEIENVGTDDIDFLGFEMTWYI